MAVWGPWQRGEVWDVGTYRGPPSTGLPDCRRPSPLVLALGLKEGLPEVCAELTALPEELLAAAAELRVEAIA